MSKNVTMQDLEVIKGQIEKGKELFGKAQGRMESLEQQDKDITAQIEALGVQPENLEQEISNIDQQIQELFAEAKSLIPEDILS